MAIMCQLCTSLRLILLVNSRERDKLKTSNCRLQKTMSFTVVFFFPFLVNKNFVSPDVAKDTSRCTFYALLYLVVFLLKKHHYNK